MKKLVAFLLTFGMLMGFSACGKEPEMVTIYIPATVEFEVGEGTFYGPLDIVFEENWQTKDRFTMSYSIDSDGAELKNTTIYGDKTTEVTSGGSTRVSVYDEKGRVTLQTVTGVLGEYVLKVETATEYDEHGRTQKKTQTTYYTDGRKNDVSVTTYTYTDLVAGSEGSCEQDGYIYKVFYDEQYRCIGALTLQDGKEINKTEYTYDENGNPESSTTYTDGEQESRAVYTYKKVEVSREKADKLPQFIRVK